MKENSFEYALGRVGFWNNELRRHGDVINLGLFRQFSHEMMELIQSNPNIIVTWMRSHMKDNGLDYALGRVWFWNNKLRRHGDVINLGLLRQFSHEMMELIE